MKLKNKLAKDYISIHPVPKGNESEVFSAYLAGFEEARKMARLQFEVLSKDGQGLVQAIETLGEDEV